MPNDLVPSSLIRFPFSRFPVLWDDDDDWSLAAATPTGLTIAEDEQNVYVEAALPGLDPKDIDITFDKGVVWIKGESKEEETKKKYYRKATSSFSYRVAVPGDIDPNADPVATYKSGVMKVSFRKSAASQPKKIAFRSDK